MEHRREATIKYSDSIFPVRILRILTYQPCKYIGMGMHSAVVSKSVYIYTGQPQLDVKFENS